MAGTVVNTLSDLDKFVKTSLRDQLEVAKTTADKWETGGKKR